LFFACLGSTLEAQGCFFAPLPLFYRGGGVEDVEF
jgi:hypothetical protein